MYKINWKRQLTFVKNWTRFLARNESELFIDWDEDQTGAENGFMIHVQRLKKDLEGLVTASETSATFNNLEPCTDYSIRIMKVDRTLNNIHINSLQLRTGG